MERCGCTRPLAGGAVVVGEKRSDWLIHRHMLGAFGHQELTDAALIHRLDLHGRLVGLDLGDHVAAPHRVAFFDVPFDQLALFHGGRQRAA